MKTFKQFLNKKTLSVTELAKKHGISVEKLQAQLKKGIATEKEHTTHNNIAKKIASDHLGEDPKYYDKLQKMENK